MVVISAAVLSKGGKVILSRQFVPIPKSRIEGLLAAFPKLLGNDIQHTFIETEHVRYIYQPLEQLFLVLITNRQSNIMEDLDTLRLFAKLIPEYCGAQTEENVSRKCYELLFAFDEVISIGHKENVTVQQIKTFTEMDSHEEKLHKIIQESKVNEAREEARRKAEIIDKQKAEMRKLSRGFSGGGSSKYDIESRAGGSGGRGGFGSSDNAYDGDRNSSGFSSSTSSDSFSSDRSSSSSSSSSSKKSTANSSASSSSAAKGGPLGKGMQLSKAKKQQEDFFAAIANEEKIVEAKALGTTPEAVAKASAAAKASQSISIAVDEKLVVVLERDCSLKKMEVKGEMKLSILDPDDSKIIVKTNGALKESDGFKCRLHPKINKTAWTNDAALGLADASKGFPVGSDNAPVILKWNKKYVDDSDIPITVNFWPNVENGQSVVSVEFNSDTPHTFGDVVMRIPCPSSEPPHVSSCDGDFKFDQKTKALTWAIGEVSPNRKSGSLEFSVPELDGDQFYPIQINFSSNNTFSGIEVTAVVASEGGNERQNVTTSLLSTEQYVIE